VTLVRHGRPAIDPSVPAARWELAVDAADEVRAVGPVGQAGARWCTSPEPKAVATALLLAPASATVPVEVINDLREAERTAAWFDSSAEFAAVVRQAFRRPDQPVLPGWEPLTVTQARVVAAVRALLADARPLVLVGHGTAWTLLVAALTGAEPDLDAWAAMPLPAVAELAARPNGTATLIHMWRG
jgi:broad specificity phosphatase PhoE